MRKQAKKRKKFKAKKKNYVSSSPETVVEEEVLRIDQQIDYSEHDINSLNNTIADIRRVIIGIVLVVIFFIGISYWFSASSFLPDFGVRLAELAGLS